MKSIFILYIIFLSQLIISCVNTETITEPAQIHNSFSNGSFEIGFYGWDVGRNVNNDFNLSSDDPFDGNFCAEIYLDSNCRRAELSRINCADIGTIMRYKWAYKIHKDYINSDSTQTIHQFHDYPDFHNGETWETMTVYPPPVFTTMRNDSIFIRVHTIESGYKTLGTIKINKNEWIQIEYLIRWSLNDNGFVEAKINNEYLTPFNGVDNKYYMPTAYNNMGNFFKVGLYRSPSIKQQSRVFVDNLQIYQIN